MKLSLRSEQQTPDTVISPVKGSFDLSGGAFKFAEKRRHFLLGVTLLSVAALTLFTMTGLFAVMRNSTALKATESAAASRQESLATLARVDQAEGYPAETLRSHILPRQKALTSALSEDVDNAVLIGAVLASTPPGMTVSSVTLTWSAPAVNPSAAPSASAAPVAPADPAAPSPAATAALPAPAAGSVITLTVVATGDFQAILDMKNRLSQISGVAPLVEDPTWTGAGTQTTVTFVTTLTPDAASQRAQAAKSADEYGQAVVADTPPSQPGSSSQPVPAQTSAQPVPAQPSAQPVPAQPAAPAASAVPAPSTPTVGGQ